MKKIITTSTLIISASLILAGCCSSRKSSYAETESVSESSGAQAPSASMATGNEVVIPLHQEQVSVGKQSVDAGQVTIRKVVTTETVSQPVQLRKENLVIERQPASAAGADSGTAFEEKSYTIQLQDEQPVISKSTVVTGTVVAKKNATMQQQNISQQLRKEDIQYDKTGTAGVTIINEGAGAQPQQQQQQNQQQNQQQ